MYDDLHGYWWVHIKNILSLDIFLCGACNRGLIFIHIALCKNHHNGAQSFLKWNLNTYSYNTIRYVTIQIRYDRYDMVFGSVKETDQCNGTENNHEFEKM